MKAVKHPSNAQRIAQYLGQDEMNSHFVRLAIDHYAELILEADDTADAGIISLRLLKDMAEDWKNGN